MIQKPGKNPTDVASYRPISLLSISSKILEKLLLKKRYKPPRMDSLSPIWILQSTFNNTTMPSHYRYNQQSF